MFRDGKAYAHRSGMMANLSRHVAIAGLAGLLAACAASSSEWQERLTVLPAAGDRLIGERLIDAQYVVAGRLEHVERADLYEPHGGWLMRMLFHDQGAPEAYEAKIQVDSVLRGGGAPDGAPGPGSVSRRPTGCRQEVRRSPQSGRLLVREGEPNERRLAEHRPDERQPHRQPKHVACGHRDVRASRDPGRRRAPAQEVGSIHQIAR